MVVAVGGHPGIELATAHEDLAADSVTGKGVTSVVKVVPKLPDAEPTVRGEGPEGEERVELGRVVL